MKIAQRLYQTVNSSLYEERRSSTGVQRIRGLFLFDQLPESFACPRYDPVEVLGGQSQSLTYYLLLLLQDVKAVQDFPIPGVRHFQNQCSNRIVRLIANQLPKMVGFRIAMLLNEIRIRVSLPSCLLAKIAN